MAIPRSEFPRPDFERKEWKCLNGEWDFMFDEKGRFRSFQEAEAQPFAQKITVPFCYQSKASGIGDTRQSDAVWYRRTVALAAEEIECRSVLLKFGAVDFFASVWVNGLLVGTHAGGNTSFAFDITDAVHCGENTIVVCARDSESSAQPRGKQSWLGAPFACWYTPTTGIWQSVWMEFAGSDYITGVRFTPNLKTKTALCEMEFSTLQKRIVQVEATVAIEGVGTFQQALSCTVADGHGRVSLTFPDFDHRCFDSLYWTPEHPNLIDVNVRLECPDGWDDCVKTYFGFRSITAENGCLCLNGRPYFQRLVLDQGYWPETLLTAPSDEAFIEDIRLTKAMGFNGARKHQKIEDPRYYYWADKMGLLVWGELPSCYDFCARAQTQAMEELRDFVLRDYNHPSIVLWVPLNESWGVVDIYDNVQQQNYARALYYLLKSLDPTRLVSTNDGWEQINETDICALHDYALFPDNVDKYGDLENYMVKPVQDRLPFAKGNQYCGQPLMVTEYGGIAFSGGAEGQWGYFGAVGTEEEFFARLEPVTRLFTRGRRRFSGFCYTQLTDVMQEVNGLLSADRTPKVSVERLKKVFGESCY